MARIAPLALDADDVERDFARDVTELLGRVPNFFRTVAHSPAVVRWLVPFVATIHREGTGSLVDARTKNLVILRTSILNQCKYCIGHNQAFARSLGVPEEVLQELEKDDCSDSDYFAEREKAVIWWTDEVTHNTARYAAECFENLETHFSHAQITELTLLCGMFNMVNRFNESLHVDLEDEEQQAQIGRTRVLSEATIFDYARRRVHDFGMHDGSRGVSPRVSTQSGD